MTSLRTPRALRPSLVLLPAALLCAGSPATAQEGEEMFDRTFDGADALDVEVADADVIVEPGTGADVRVRVLVNASDPDDARDLYEAMDFEAVSTGSTVRVRARDPQMGRDWWRRGRWAGATVVVTAPTSSRIDVHTSDGDIELGSSSGNVSLRSSDGDIDAGRLTGNRVDIHTSDGDIRVTHVRGAEVTVRTSDGDVDVAASGGSLEASSSDGDVWIELEQNTEVRVRTGDGDITLRAPATLAAEVVLDGEDMDIDPAFMLQGRIRNDRVTGTLNGGGPLLEARTGDGSISLEVLPVQVR